MENNIQSKINKILLGLMLAIATQAAWAVETITYYHNDALGSPVAATDANGAILWKEDYHPYGSRIREESTDSNQAWYTGKHHEKDIGLTYFGARWYDPTLGRFMAIDPVGFKQGNIHSHNRYAYANNNPYLFVDPDGNSPVHAAKFLADVGLNLTLNYMTTGQFQTGAAFKEAIEGLANPFKSIDKVKKLDKLLSKGGNVAKGADKLAPKVIQENPRNLIPTQTKSEMSGSQVKRLTKDMKQNGFDQSKPVDAWRNPNTRRLEIQDGHHRTEAAKKAGLDKIPVKVWE